MGVNESDRASEYYPKNNFLKSFLRILKVLFHEKEP